MADEAPPTITFIESAEPTKVVEKISTEEDAAQLKIQKQKRLERFGVVAEKKEEKSKSNDKPLDSSSTSTKPSMEIDLDQLIKKKREQRKENKKTGKPQTHKRKSIDKPKKVEKDIKSSEPPQKKAKLSLDTALEDIIASKKLQRKRRN